HEELKSRQFWRCVLAELAGTLILVSVILGASFPSQEKAPCLLQPALAAGLSAVSLVHCFGDISGAQNWSYLEPYVQTYTYCTYKHTTYACKYTLTAHTSIHVCTCIHLHTNLHLHTSIHLRTCKHSLTKGKVPLYCFMSFHLKRTAAERDKPCRKRRTGPGNGDFLHLPAGVYHICSGGPSAQGGGRAWQSGNRLLPGSRDTSSSKKMPREFEPSTIPGACNPHRNLGTPLEFKATVISFLSLNCRKSSDISHPSVQVFWIGPVLGAVLAGVSYEFFFASSASREKLIACITCKDIEIVETASVSRSSLSTVTQTAMRAKQAHKHDNN
uniref:Uncharacterized protein n=1 Tax=Latimeria chalumnae TaxID=7897 RepID=H3BIC4_LATCH